MADSPRLMETAEGWLDALLPSVESRSEHGSESMEVEDRRFTGTNRPDEMNDTAISALSQDFMTSWLENRGPLRTEHCSEATSADPKQYKGIWSCWPEIQQPLTTTGRYVDVPGDNILGSSMATIMWDTTRVANVPLDDNRGSLWIPMGGTLAWKAITDDGASFLER